MPEGSRSAPRTAEARLRLPDRPRLRPSRTRLSAANVGGRWADPLQTVRRDDLEHGRVLPTMNVVLQLVRRQVTPLGFAQPDLPGRTEPEAHLLDDCFSCRVAEDDHDAVFGRHQSFALVPAFAEEKATSAIVSE